MDPVQIMLALACTLSIGGSVGCLAWILTRSTPATILREQQSASATADLALRKTEGMELRMAGWKEELDGYMRAVDDSLARTEVKRKRIDATEARAHRRDQNLQADEPQTREQLVMSARRKVYGVG